MAKKKKENNPLVFDVEGDADMDATPPINEIDTR